MSTQTCKTDYDDWQPAKEKKLVQHQAQITIDYVQPANIEPAQGSLPVEPRCTAMIISRP